MHKQLGLTKYIEQIFWRNTYRIAINKNLSTILHWKVGEVKYLAAIFEKNKNKLDLSFCQNKN